MLPYPTNRYLNLETPMLTLYECSTCGKRSYSAEEIKECEFSHIDPRELHVEQMIFSEGDAFPDALSIKIRGKLTRWERRS